MDLGFKILGMTAVKAPKEEDLKAICEIQIGGCVTIRGVRIVQVGEGKVFCGMPRERFFSKSADRPLSRAVVLLREDLRAEIYKAILNEWSRIQGLKFQNEGGH